MPESDAWKVSESDVVEHKCSQRSQVQGLIHRLDRTAFVMHTQPKKKKKRGGGGGVEAE